MTIDYWLFRTSSNPHDSDAVLPPFGSQEEVIERLCSVPGFELYRKESLENSEPFAIITYIEEDSNGEAQDVEFNLSGDPVTCISISRASREDFLPIVHALSNLAPFAIVDIDGEAISPDELD